MMEPNKITHLKYPLSRRPPAGSDMAMKHQTCTEPIQLILEEDDVPDRTYKSWYTPNDDMYPKVAKSANHLDRNHQRRRNIMQGVNTPSCDGAPRCRVAFWFRHIL